ncbi:hypothetical protein ABIF81_002169 [Bradyrhizobium daqingense]
MPDFPKRTGPDPSGPVRFILCNCEKILSWQGTSSGLGAYLLRIGGMSMLVERGLRAMNVELVSEAYAIAANYLRRSGAIPDTLVTDERLLGIIIKLLQQGEFNKIRLANMAIARFETQSEARAVA